MTQKNCFILKFKMRTLEKKKELGLEIKHWKRLKKLKVNAALR